MTLINFKVPDKLMCLIEQVDAYVASTDTTRSQFIRTAIADKLAMTKKLQERELRR